MNATAHITIPQDVKFLKLTPTLTVSAHMVAAISFSRYGNALQVHLVNGQVINSIAPDGMPSTDLVVN